MARSKTHDVTVQAYTWDRRSATYVATDEFVETGAAALKHVKTKLGPGH